MKQIKNKWSKIKDDTVSIVKLSTEKFLMPIDLFHG